MVVSGSAEGHALLQPFRRWLTRHRGWYGPGAIDLDVGRPELVHRAFTVAGAIRSYAELEREGQLVWFFPPVWGQGVLHLMDWHAEIRALLDYHLKTLARSPQGDLFGGLTPEARGG